MLVSHAHKFIFIKTAKTAGTAVELLFERLMMPSDHLVTEACGQQISEFGIIGARGRFSPSEQPLYFNHIPAKKLKWLLGRSTWDSYYKFSIVRNPFESLLSGFFYTIQSNQQSFYESLMSAKFDDVQAYFEEYVMAKSNDRNRELLTINGQQAVDFCIRHEHLNTDISTVLSKLNLQADVSDLSSAKSGIRPSSGVLAGTKKFYRAHMITHVTNVFRWHFENFDYEFNSLPD